MRKLLVIILGFISYTSPAQEKFLIAECITPDIYLVHTVAPKENYYSIGRMYNTSPKELAPYNSLAFEKGLSLGQTIKIPLNASNFSQGDAPKSDEVLVPVYHLVQAKEGLFRISQNYNKVARDLLKKWNNLSADAVSNGTKLIIGYLKVQKEQSALASMAISNVSDVVIKAPEKEEKKTKVKEVEKKDPEKEVVKIKEKTEVPNNHDKIQSVQDNTNTSEVNFNGGKFKKLYTDQTNNKSLVMENGMAATFKTTSGFQDGKYYCFHNSAEPGTIIKVTNNANGKSIYAKVLDAIPDIKQNSGLLLRISNAAAEELGVTDKFDCTISYAK